MYSGKCLVWLLAGLVMVACGHESSRHTVRFWAMGREAEVVAALVRDFEKEYPGIHVELQNIPMSAAHEKLLTAFAADRLPDVCQLGNTWLPEFALLDALEPLQPYVSTSKVVMSADYFPGVWETNVVAGRLYGVPWYVDTRLLFYRKDILEAAGYRTPLTTWADWEDRKSVV